MSDTIIAFISGSTVAVLASFLASYLNHIFSERRTRLKEFNNAAINFRSAFIKEQRLLALGTFIDKPNNLTVQKIIADSINRHEIAMIRFKPFVCKSKIRDYEKAWKDYTGNSYHFEQYDGNMLSGKDTLALSRIEKLLKFANPK